MQQGVMETPMYNGFMLRGSMQDQMEVSGQVVDLGLGISQQASLVAIFRSWSQ